MIRVLIMKPKFRSTLFDHNTLDCLLITTLNDNIYYQLYLLTNDALMILKTTGILA